MLWLFLVLIGLAEFSEITREGFHILYPPEMEHYAKEVLKQAPRAKKLMAEQLRLDLDQEIQVVISKEADFGKIQPGLPPEWASATAYPEKNLIFLKPLARAGWEDYQKTFRHELAHLFLHHRLKGKRAPLWFEEGMAIIMSGEFSFERVRLLAQIGLTGRYLPFSELDQSFPFHTNPAQLAYLQSEALVSFIITQLGTEKFNQLLDRISQEENFYSALSLLSGWDWETWEKKWQNHLKYRYSLALALGGSTTLWFLITILFLIAYLTKRRRSKLMKEFGYEGYGDLEEDEEDEEDDENWERRDLWH